MLDSSDEGVAILSLENAKASDSGTYSFTVTNEFGSASCSCVLTVLSNNSPLGKFFISYIIFYYIIYLTSAYS